jgi:hypothetical protein
MIYEEQNKKRRKKKEPTTSRILLTVIGFGIYYSKKIEEPSI